MHLKEWLIVVTEKPFVHHRRDGADRHRDRDGRGLLSPVCAFMLSSPTDTRSATSGCAMRAGSLPGSPSSSPPTSSRRRSPTLGGDREARRDRGDPDLPELLPGTRPDRSARAATRSRRLQETEMRCAKLIAAHCLSFRSLLAATAGSARMPKPIRCRPGTTDAPKQAITGLRRARDDARARPDFVPLDDASPPSTMTARSGPSSRSTSRSPSPSTASRRWRRTSRMEGPAAVQGVLEGDVQALARPRARRAFSKIMAATHSGMTTGRFDTTVQRLARRPRATRASTGPTTNSSTSR